MNPGINADMDETNRTTTILDGFRSSDPGNLFYHNDSQRFCVPVIGNDEPEINKCRERMTFTQSLLSGRAQQPASKLSIAFLDTGILPEHPMFKPYIRETIDFTGEGIEDANGHGSICTWIFLCDSAINCEINLYIAKILSNNGEGSEKDMIKGIEWAKEKGVRFINLSAGIEQRSFLNLWECKGTCKLCQAAYNLKSSNTMLFAAAGNNGKTVCPAKVGLLYQDSSVISVGATDAAGNNNKWSGKGNLYAPGDVQAAQLILC